MAALSGFKADFNPLLGTSDSPANYASRNMKMVAYLRYNLVNTLKRSRLHIEGQTQPSSYFATHSLRGKHVLFVMFFGGSCLNTKKF